MFNLNFNVGDVNDKLSLAYAVARGYRFRLEDDGSVEIQNPQGIFYYLHNWTCSCPDKLLRGGSYKGHCKHAIYTAQMLPCSRCQGVMLLGEYKPWFGKAIRRFECPTCGRIQDQNTVYASRLAVAGAA